MILALLSIQLYLYTLYSFYSILLKCISLFSVWGVFLNHKYSFFLFALSLLLSCSRIFISSYFSLGVISSRKSLSPKSRLGAPIVLTLLSLWVQEPHLSYSGFHSYCLLTETSPYFNDLKIGSTTSKDQDLKLLSVASAPTQGFIYARWVSSGDWMHSSVTEIIDTVLYTWQEIMMCSHHKYPQKMMTVWGDGCIN